MSQQKVDKYKENKANRSQIMKKQKRIVRTEMVAMVVVIVGLLVWFGYSYHGRVEEKKPPVEYPIDSGVIDDYLSDLGTPADETDEADEVETEEQ